MLHRDMSQRNKHAFCEVMYVMNWATVMGITNPQKALSAFYSEILRLYYTLFPKRKVKAKYSMTQVLCDVIKKENKIYLNLLHSTNVANETIYKSYQNKLNRILRNAEKGIFEVLWRLTRDLWQIRNKLKYSIYKDESQHIQSKFKINKNTFVTDRHIISDRYNCVSLLNTFYIIMSTLQKLKRWKNQHVAVLIWIFFFIFKTCHLHLDTGSKIYWGELLLGHRSSILSLSFSIICAVVTFQHVKGVFLGRCFWLTLFWKHFLTCWTV